MIRCSFCEAPLVCHACGKQFQPKRGETHLAIYHPDMAVSCPECLKPLICKHCGFTFGVDEKDD